MSTSKLQSMLRDRYYIGVITYLGEDFKGRHEAIIDRASFDRVQVVMDLQRTAGERRRVHQHYLKGTLWCNKCRERGVNSRMILQRSVGRHGGEYLYFFCIARQEAACDSGYVPVDVMEGAVERHYHGIQLPVGFADTVNRKLDEVLSDEHRTERLMRTHLNDRLARLDAQEENLLDLAVDAETRVTSCVRLQKLGEERDALRVQLDGAIGGLNVGVGVIRDALALLTDIPNTYGRSSEQGRRQLNQALFVRLYVDAEGVHEEELRSPFDEVLFMRRRSLTRATHERARAGTRKADTKVGAGLPGDSRTSLLEIALSDDVSSKTALVGPALHNANHEMLVNGPPITLTPHNVRQRADHSGTLRYEVLGAVTRISARTNSETVLRREVVAEVLSGGANVQKHSVYKALRRMSGREAGAAIDLEDLGDDRLRVLGPAAR